MFDFELTLLFLGNLLVAAASAAGKVGAFGGDSIRRELDDFEKSALIDSRSFGEQLDFSGISGYGEWDFGAADLLIMPFEFT